MGLKKTGYRKSFQNFLETKWLWNIAQALNSASIAFIVFGNATNFLPRFFLL